MTIKCKIYTIFFRFIRIVFNLFQQTSMFLVLLIHRLGQEPRVLRYLQEELDEIIKNPNDIITEKMLREMKYLKATVKEGFRFVRCVIY